MTTDPGTSKKLEDLRQKILAGNAPTPPQIASPVVAAVSAEEEAKQQAQLLDLNEKRANQKHQEVMNALTQQKFRAEIDHRKELTNGIFQLIKYWLVFVGVLVYLDGCADISLGAFKFVWHIPDPLLTNLLVTTTATVVGLFATVTGYYFIQRNSDQKL